LGPTKPSNHNFYGPKFKLYSWGISQTQILLWGLLPILGAQWGLLGFRGPKLNFTLGSFVLLGRILNSNFIPRAFAHFWGLTKPNNHHFYGPKLKFYCGGICPFGEAPKSNFTAGAFAHFGAHPGHFGVQGCQNFGKWYQKTNTILKIQITLFAFKIIAIHDNTLLAPANGQKHPKSNLSLGPQRWAKAPKSYLSSGH
jgi:hypothetical protein